MAVTNLATKYAKQVDERFSRESQAMLGCNTDYSFKGAETVMVYSVPVAAMHDYTRSGSNRYGTPEDLGNSVQELKITRDRSFTYVIDKGDKTQSMMVMDAGQSLARQLRLVVIPEIDTYIFDKQCRAAFAHGHTDATAATEKNAYKLFLNAQEKLGDKNVPDSGRVAFCTYKFANLLKQDPAFMKYGDLSQEMVRRGEMGDVDGCKIVRVPSSRLPKGCDFLLVHPLATTAPKQLEDFKIHDNPPGISGWLVEGRVIYDAFVLNNKADALFYQGTAFTDSTEDDQGSHDGT